MAQNKKIKEYRRRIKKSKNNAKYPRKRVQKNLHHSEQSIHPYYSAQNMREHAEYGNTIIFGV